MFTIKGVVYPEKISQRITVLRHKRSKINANAAATAANFGCGSFVRFSLSIDTETHTVADVSFSSNGCGFMVAAADILAEHITKKNLTDLNGLDGTELNNNVYDHLGELPPNRRDCVTECVEALRAAFADHRARQIEEFHGEKALICTCFGVSEETIENLIARESLKTVDEVTTSCNAGGGCGSCRMLIQEIIDEHQSVEVR